MEFDRFRIVEAYYVAACTLAKHSHTLAALAVEPSERLRFRPGQHVSWALERHARDAEDVRTLRQDAAAVVRRYRRRAW